MEEAWEQWPRWKLLFNGVYLLMSHFNCFVSDHPCDRFVLFKGTRSSSARIWRKWCASGIIQSSFVSAIWTGIAVYEVLLRYAVCLKDTWENISARLPWNCVPIIFNFCLFGCNGQGLQYVMSFKFICVFPLKRTKSMLTSDLRRCLLCLYFHRTTDLG